MSSTPTTPMSATPARPPARPAATTSSAPSARATSVKSLARSVLISLGFALVALLIAGVAFAWVWPSIGEPALWGAFALFGVPLLAAVGIIVGANEKLVPSRTARGLIIALLMIGAFILGGFAFLHGWFLAMNGLAIGMAASVLVGLLAITVLFEVRRRMKH